MWYYSNKSVYVLFIISLPTIQIYCTEDSKKTIAPEMQDKGYYLRQAILFYVLHQGLEAYYALKAQ